METKAMPDSLTLTPEQYKQFCNSLIRDYKMQLEMNDEEDIHYYAQLLSTALTNATCSGKGKGLTPFFPVAFAIEEREHNVRLRKVKAA
jgi:phage-related protein